jgi:hypothetical protein
MARRAAGVMELSPRVLRRSPGEEVTVTPWVAARMMVWERESLRGSELVKGPARVWGTALATARVQTWG